MITNLTNTALEAFWQTVVDRHPKSKTGDVSPQTLLALQTAAEKAINDWIFNNVEIQIDGWTRLAEFGCYVQLSEDREAIFECPMNADGSPEREADGELNYVYVTCPEPEFVNAINERFGTAFRYEDFAGR